jgi:hypothetical protein
MTQLTQENLNKVTDLMKVLDLLQKGMCSKEQVIAWQAFHTPKPKTQELTWKISASGCIAVYGLNQMPTSLRPSQWLRLAEKMPELVQFITDNNGKTFDAEVKTKGADGKWHVTGKTKVVLTTQKTAKTAA